MTRQDNPNINNHGNKLSISAFDRSGLLLKFTLQIFVEAHIFITNSITKVPAANIIIYCITGNSIKSENIKKKILNVTYRTMVVEVIVDVSGLLGGIPIGIGVTGAVSGGLVVTGSAI
jgi:hypothetical protein